MPCIVLCMHCVGQLRVGGTAGRWLPKTTHDTVFVFVFVFGLVFDFVFVLSLSFTFPCIGRSTESGRDWQARWLPNTTHAIMFVLVLFSCLFLPLVLCLHSFLTLTLACIGKSTKSGRSWQVAWKDHPCHRVCFDFCFRVCFRFCFCVFICL